MSQFMPVGYEIVECDDLIDSGPVDRYWRRSKAERRQKKLNRDILAPSYRWCVVKDGRRWTVVAKQNKLQPKGGNHEADQQA